MYSAGYNKYLITMFLLMLPFYIKSQNKAQPVSDESKSHEITDSATFHFPQSHSNMNLGLPGNREELEKIEYFMNQYNSSDSLYRLKSMTVIGGASPEGSVEINERLSHGRAENIFEYITKREQVPDSVTTFVFLGRDWNGLKNLVYSDTIVPYRSEVIEVIEKTLKNGPENPSVSDEGLRKLRALHKGLPYRYLYSHHFPELRTSKLFVKFARNQSVEPDIKKDTVVGIEENALPNKDNINSPWYGEDNYNTTDTIADEEHCKPFYMSLKTNLLYDALLLPSAGAEFYLGKNWSVGINWTYGWWSKDRRHDYWRAYGGDINVRRWFGKKADEKPLTGHHLGLYFGVITYDFEFGGKGYMGGLPHRTLWDRCNYTGGIEYGYSLPIGRRLNLDFTLGIGYLGGKYIVYRPEGNKYIWQKTMRMNWFGPTKAEVSLVWLIGCDNFNRNGMKGGKL